MMTEANLKEIIKTYISKDENHILPITTNWFLPEVGEGEEGNVIGYRSKKKNFPLRKFFSLEGLQ